MRTHLLALAATLTLTTFSGAAWATGMQGHIYMAQCGAELSQNPRVKQIVAAHPMMLANGGILPDSGYATSDYDQGEIPHWEEYVEGFIEQLRERHGGADAPESWANVAVLFGLSAHGITDSTFDTLFFPRVEQEDRPEDIDLAADVLYVALTGKKFIPDVVLDTAFASDVFQNKISHDVTKDEISSAMKTARSGIGATVLIAKSPGFYEKNYPWERRSLLDPRVPGAYAFGSRVVTRYYDELLRRLDGNTSADGAVIGTYPTDGYPMAALRKGRPDARVLFYFGIGIERESLDGVLRVTGPDGAEIPGKVGTFRGDKWANVLQFVPDNDWTPATTYTVQLKNTFRTLQGTSPSAPLEFTFTTCAPDPATGECPEPQGAPPPSPCPLTDKIGVEVDEGEAGAGGDSGTGGDAGGAQAGSTPQPAAPQAAASGDEGGCSASGRGSSLGGAAAGLAAALLFRPRRRRR